MRAMAKFQALTGEISSKLDETKRHSYEMSISFCDQQMEPLARLHDQALCDGSELMARLSGKALVRLPFAGTAFDEKGVIAYYATEAFTQPFSNPARPHHADGNALLTTSASSIYRGSSAMFVHANCTNPSLNCTKSEPDSWMALDLGPGRTLRVSDYCLRHGRPDGGEVLRNWHLLGSNDGASWSVLKEHKEDESLILTSFAIAAWPVKTSEHYRHFKVMQTGRNSSQGINLYCCGFELYGDLTTSLGFTEDHAQIS